MKQFLIYCENDSFPLTFPFFRLLAFSRIRKEEALLLTWNDVNFKNKQYSINEIVSTQEKKQVFTALSKIEISIGNGLHHRVEKLFV